MLYFIRNIIMYLVLFVALAFGIQWGLQTYYLPKKSDGGAPKQIFTMPNLNIQARETKTGLFLAGLSAQNRRDWDSAWQYFSKLNDKYDGDAAIALRSFTLALGSGEYKNALTIAQNVKDKHLNNENEEPLQSEGYDLIRLMLLLEDIKANPETDIKAAANQFQSRAIRNVVNEEIAKDSLENIAVSFHDFAKELLLKRAIDSALLFARMAAYIDQNTPSIYVTIGNIFQYQGQSDEALAAYQKIQKEDALYDLAITNYIDILIQKDDLNGAENILQSRIDYDPNSALYHYLMGGVKRAMKDYEDAIEFYNMAENLGFDPETGNLKKDFWPLYYARAVAYDFNDEWDKAEADLMVAMEKLPNNPIILNYLGYAYADKNINLEKAKEMISKAVMAAPNDGYIIDSMGWILYRMGFYEEAVKYLERAARIRPYHMVINDHLGDAYWKVGRTIEAHYMWQRALDHYDDTDEEQQRMIEQTKRKVKEGF